MPHRPLTIILAILLAAASHTAIADDLGAPHKRSLATCIPDDAMAALLVRPSPAMRETTPGGTIDQLAGWLVTFQAMGVIPDEGRIIADAIATLPILIRRPHAVMLLDITARRLEADSYRLRHMQAALVIDDEGMSPDIERRIRDLLATYTSVEQSRIQIIHLGEHKFYQLADERIPGWATLAWGEVGRRFVVAFGEGTYEKLLSVLTYRENNLTDDPWFRKAHDACHGDTSGLEAYVDIARITGRLSETITSRPNDVLQQIGIQQADRLVWSVGFDDRALRSELFTRSADGKDDYTLLAGPSRIPARLRVAVPSEARHYAVLPSPLGDSIRQARDAWLTSKSDSTRDQWHDTWQRIETEFDFNAEEGFLAQLGKYLVLHDFPEHPMRLPVPTIWLEITGDADTTRDTIDRMMQAWQRYLNPAPTPETKLSLTPRVIREADGLWYMQLGLIQPALAVADDWIVISFSPEAVRTNLTHLQSLKPKPEEN